MFREVLHKFALIMIGSLAQPNEGFADILRYPIPPFIPKAKLILRGGISMLGRFLIPENCLDNVPRHSLTEFVCKTQFVFGSGVSLIGGLS